MQHNTLATLGKLQIGDRFTYPGKTEIWEVVLHLPNTKKTAINQPGNGKRWKYDYPEQKKQDTQVRFLRHTVIQPGQQCFIQDLVPGDVFFKPDDVVTEYVIVRPLATFPNFVQIRKVYDKETVEPEMAGKLATVILVRKAEKEVKA